MAEIHKAPPGIHTKKRIPMKPANFNGRCCLTAKQWEQLRDHLSEYPRLAGRSFRILVSDCRRTGKLKFSNRLDDEAVAEALIGIGFFIDETGKVRRKAGAR